MVDTNLLRAAMAAKGMNQKMLAAAINMPDGTLSRKIRKGVFDTDEVLDICEALEIKEPDPIFLIRKSLNE